MLNWKRLLLSLVALFGLAAVLVSPAFSQSNHVVLARLDGVINPVAAGYIERAVGAAEDGGAQALLIEMDTPGGLSDSMDIIIKSIVNSRVPVVVYVYPPGGRAASAGTYIAYAAHIAAMAPSTNIGSASPVAISPSGGTEELTGTMELKVVNDAVAKIRGLAALRGRNADWAEKAVREAANVSADEALQLNVVDLIADSPSSLLDKIDGRQVQTMAGSVTLHTKGAAMQSVDMTFIEEFLNVISDPNIAAILLSLGMLAIFFELSSPGAILPGVVGGIFLLLAFYAFGTLPINYTGLFLVVFSFILFIADLFVPTHGVLSLGGVVSLVLGLLFLFNTAGVPFYQVSLPVIVTIVVLVGGFFVFAIRAIIKARLRKPWSGREGMVGDVAEVRSDLNPEGMVFVEGELWSAVSEDGYIKAGESAQVTGMEGLKLRVRRYVPLEMESRSEQQAAAARKAGEVPQKRGVWLWKR